MSELHLDHLCTGECLDRRDDFERRIAYLSRWLLDIAHRGHAGDPASCLAADCVDARAVVGA